MTPPTAPFILAISRDAFFGGFAPGEGPGHPRISAGVPIYGYIYDAKPGRLIEVPAATEAGKA
jgi:hypothetical protein